MNEKWEYVSTTGQLRFHNLSGSWLADDPVPPDSDYQLIATTIAPNMVIVWTWGRPVRWEE